MDGEIMWFDFLAHSCSQTKMSRTGGTEIMGELITVRRWGSRSIRWKIKK